mgnify:CR=1 FL=1
MVKILTATRFGNPILREKARLLTDEEILHIGTQKLIENIRHTLTKEDYGVGLAAPQVGVSIALSVIGIKPTPTRPNLTPFSAVIINPKITEMFGRRKQKWEGCISCGSGDDTLYGKVPRYERIKVKWLDETVTLHEEVLDGFVAHVVQHEVDHLNGILFVDRVKDSKTFMMADEYRKRIVRKEV